LSRIAPRGAAAFAALLALFLACAFVGGAIDPAVAAWAGEIRIRSPLLLQSALVLTQLGAAPITLGLGAAGALLLAGLGHSGRGAILGITIVAERLAVDGLKMFFGRARPEFDPQLVQVYNLSFPSGHAANSLTAYVLLAFFLVPGRFRTAALVAAFAIAFLVGLTRILIGVHWLSDVLGGWAAGLVAVMLALGADRRLGAREQ
jgi:membrane-associated phospholipid phosphatase